jgi:cysteine synthase A
MGVGRFLRAMEPAVKVHALEPASSPTLSTGHKVGSHRIQGISDDFVPAIVDLDMLDDVLAVDDGDAILMARKLAAELGLGVGISSGANLLGALLAQERLGADAVVVTVFPDDNKKYLSTDLMRDEPAKSGHLTNDIELRGFAASKRVCITCCDGDECERREMLDADARATRPYCARER